MSKKYSSKAKRQDPLFLRNDFPMDGKYGMPIIKKCELDVSSLWLIGADEIKIDEQSSNIARTVHFFLDDYKFENYYNKPQIYIERLAQYPHVLTPDYSLYIDMPIATQIFNTFKNRWCGAYWQDYNLSVIPTVGWSTVASYDFCFDGLEYGTVVAISTVGAMKSKDFFLKGYFEMKKRIAPSQVLCYGKGFPEMGGEVIEVDYQKTKRGTK